MLFRSFSGVYDTNNADNVRNIVAGPKQPEAETDSYRVSVNWQPGDNFNARFVYQHIDRYSDDSKSVSGSDSLGVKPTLTPQDEVSLAKSNNFGELDADIYNLTMNWEMAGHDWTMVYGRQESVKIAQTENDRADYIQDPQALTHQGTNTEVESDNIELRIASLGNDSWDYMFGLYWNDQETETLFEANTTIPSQIAPPPFAGLSFSTVGAIPVNGEQTAIFTHNKFYVSDAWTVELGLRYTEFESFRRADVFFGEYIIGPPDALFDLVDTLLKDRKSTRLNSSHSSVSRMPSSA